MSRLRLIQILLVIFTILSMVFGVIAFLGTCDEVQDADIPAIWFDDVRNSPPITAFSDEALIKSVSDAVFKQKPVTEGLPEHLRKDVSPRMLFISVSDGVTPAHVALGYGHGIAGALERAMSDMDALKEAGYQPKWVKLDIVKYVYPMGDVKIDQVIEFRGLAGLAFSRESGVSFLPEELLAYLPLKDEPGMPLGTALKYLKERPVHEGKIKRVGNSDILKAFRFTTTGFFSDGREGFPLKRGRRIIGQISEGDLLSSARLAGDYLTRAVDSDGRFIYEYDPRDDDVKSGYNILRHAGTVYSMLELYEITGEKELLQAAERAIGYLERSGKPCWTDKGRATCIVERGYVKLGGNALAAVALAKYMEVTGDRKYLPFLLELGKWIRDVQEENGEFSIHKQFYLTGSVSDFVSYYYPGEALLAMVRIYAIQSQMARASTGHIRGRPDQNPKPLGSSLGASHEIAPEAWLDTAEKGAKYLINIRDRAQVSQDHWLLYALNELYRYRPNPIYLSHTSRMADSIIKSQHRNPKYPDWKGGFYDPPRSTPTAIRTEGLCAAYALVRDFGAAERAERILEAIRLAIGFQLKTQFMPESVMYLAVPEKALGGFHESLTDYEIRIDYVQHNISGLLGLYRILREQDGLSPKAEE